MHSTPSATACRIAREVYAFTLNGGVANIPSSRCKDWNRLSVAVTCPNVGLDAIDATPTNTAANDARKARAIVLIKDIALYSESLFRLS